CLNRKRVLRVALQRQAGQDFCPGVGLVDQLFDSWKAVNRASLERAMLRVITAKVAGVDQDATNHTRQAQADNAPVVSWDAFAASLPTVHPFPQIGILVFQKDWLRRLQQILFWREEFIIGNEYRSTQPLCR